MVRQRMCERDSQRRCLNKSVSNLSLLLLSLKTKASPPGHLACVVLRGGGEITISPFLHPSPTFISSPSVFEWPWPALLFLLPQPAPLLAPLQAHLLMLPLAGELETLEKQVLGVLVQLHIQEVELLDASAHELAQVHVGGSRAVDLRESGDEAKAERPLKQVLRLALELSQAVESHVLQVAHGAAQKDVVTLALVHRRQVVAAHKAQVSQHAHLTVIGQVGRAVHELCQGHTGPVVPIVTVGQLVLGGGTSITHMEGSLPCGAALHMLPLTQVAGDWVTQHGDVVEVPAAKTNS